MYDSGTELQEDHRDNDSGIQYAELSQQESRKGTRKVRAGSCAQSGLSCVRPHLGLGLSTQSSAFPGPAVSLTLSRWSMVFTEKIYNWGQCSAGRFGGIHVQLMSAALVPCGSLWGLSQLF